MHHKRYSPADCIFELQHPSTFKRSWLRRTLRVLKEDKTPVRGNLSVSPEHPSSSAQKLDMEIQVRDADPDFTSPLTRNSSFESVASVDTQVTAAEFVRAKGLQDDDDDGDGRSSDAEG
jgi:hypothetical protein